MTKAKVVAIIPARCGSKSIHHKNIRMFRGLPLIVHSIKQALDCSLIDRVIVSTDSYEYAEISKTAGAEAPFIRPPEFSGDYATDLDVMRHAIGWLETEEQWLPDLIVHLRPTHPIRNSGDITAMIQKLFDNPTLDSVRSVSAARFTPYKMWFFDTTSGLLNPVIESPDIKEAYNQPRQKLPLAYEQNASIDVVRSTVILGGSMTGQKIAGYPMSHCFDIDQEGEFLEAQQFSLLRDCFKGDGFRQMRFVIDIDGIIAGITKENNYSRADPLTKNIDKINKIHELGHYIVLFTARGYKTGIDWSETTRKQLERWGVKYHELHFGKPHADFYIDDKFLSLDLIYSELNEANKSH